jgi:hypothetical protein
LRSGARRAAPLLPNEEFNALIEIRAEKRLPRHSALARALRTYNPNEVDANLLN